MVTPWDQTAGLFLPGKWLVREPRGQSANVEQDKAASRQHSLADTPWRGGKGELCGSSGRRVVMGYLQGLHLPLGFREEDEQPPESNPSFPTTDQGAVAANMLSPRSKCLAVAARSWCLSRLQPVRLLSRAEL